MNDLISRQAAIDLLRKRLIETANNNVGFICDAGQVFEDASDRIRDWIDELPSAHPESLTDKEKRIFLAAMGREEKVCEEVDRNHVREPYDSLMHVCEEIRRKVKGALWI